MPKHEALVFQIDKIEDHDNADRLGIVTVEGFTCCVRLEDFKSGDLAVYIEPDTVVPETEQFAWLGNKRRIRVQRQRGVISQGLVIPAPPDTKVGDDVFERLGLVHYEPVIHANTTGEDCPAPDIYAPIYDVDNFRKFPNIIEPGEEVVITEKIHGANGRAVFHKDEMYVGSHKRWKKYDPENLWWKALDQNPRVATWCKQHPEHILYHEVYGRVQDLRYGVPDGQYGIAGFDILHGNQWLDWERIYDMFFEGWLDPDIQFPWVPILYKGPFDKDMALELAEGDSMVKGADHMREGVVVTPVKERVDYHLGRVKLKIISNNYLSRQKKVNANE
jgi:RNA ligase (TIGR02306 family)